MPVVLVEVALPVPVRGSFAYEVPEALQARCRRGVRARVPFGRRMLVGVIMGEAAEPPEGTVIRSIDAILDETPPLGGPILDLVIWLADYYQAPLGESLRFALPPAAEARAPSERPGGGRGVRAGGEPVSLVRLSAAGGSGQRPGKNASALHAILEALQHPVLPARGDGWLGLETLRKRTGATASQLRRLESLALIEIASGPRLMNGSQHGDPASQAFVSAPEPLPAPPLTSEQTAAVSLLIPAIDAAKAEVFLLWGVTGSGKTEVYFAAARRALDRGRGVIFLVPEIALTSGLTRRVRERFGEQVALLHSGLAPAERLAAWTRIQKGQAPLVVGPRSALFAPVAKLGLVVVDEEHDPSYKQEEVPRYHARDLALVRARLEGAVAILGSATPSIESWHAARSGRYRLLRLETRIEGRPLPPVELIDMREEYRERGEPVVLSRRLVAAIDEAGRRGEQSVVLLNRRGYAAFAICQACGEPFVCRDCSVSLAYHRSDETLRCHYCGAKRPRPRACDRCASPHVIFQGEGTERIERHLERDLPSLRIARLDRDTARGRSAHDRILSEFEAKKFDVLVGTQMVAKGHDFPNVTVVGVLAADAILGFPDFRAAERTFQIITQVAGRAGRGSQPGRVLVQAFRLNHYAIRAAERHDAAEFFAKEIEYRRALSYPPFTNLATVTVTGKDIGRVAERARNVAEQLAAAGGGRVQILGPALAPISRLRGSYRFQILLKARARRRLGATLGRVLDGLAGEKGGTRDLSVDVDPIQLL